MNEATPLWAFLHDLKRVTDGYIELCGKWEPLEQNKKIAEEMHEFLSATMPANEMEEAWDVFFSVMTKLHLRGYSDYDILISGFKTLEKIQGRLREKQKEQKI